MSAELPASVDTVLESLRSAHTTVSITQIFDELGVPSDHRGRSEQMRIARVLRDQGWTRATMWFDGKIQKRWRAPQGGNDVVR